MLFASGCAAVPDAPTPAEIVAAERAFAEDGFTLGIKASFLRHSAGDAVILRPGPVNAHQSLRAAPDKTPEEAAKGPKLVWWPLYAGIAHSGDLGFTTGPFEFDGRPAGHYFTVWKKQPDGGWKWVFDAGVGADPSGEAKKDSAVAYLPTSEEHSTAPATALSEIAAIEETIAAAAERDLAAAYREFLDPDSRLHSAGPAPAKTPAARDAAFKARPAALSLKHLGGGASSAGDLVWTYGEGRWNEAGAERVAYYARIWQLRPRGWRLVFDELVPAQPAG